MGFGEQMFTKASQNSDISASCSENIVTVAFYVNVKSCRYFINRLALGEWTRPHRLVLRADHVTVPLHFITSINITLRHGTITL
jgi:hypothetical protein